MMFLKRLRAMSRLGSATLKVAERAFVRRVKDDDSARMKRLGDIEGQTARAQAHAERLESSVLLDFPDKPKGWFR